jgi:hypothetical protein
MVPQPSPYVKSCQCCGREHARRWEYTLCWIDCHPRVAWFWVGLLTINTILNILDLAGFGK